MSECISQAVSWSGSQLVSRKFLKFHLFESNLEMKTVCYLTNTVPLLSGKLRLALFCGPHLWSLLWTTAWLMTRLHIPVELSRLLFFFCVWGTFFLSTHTIERNYVVLLFTYLVCTTLLAQKKDNQMPSVTENSI